MNVDQADEAFARLEHGETAIDKAGKSLKQKQKQYKIANAYKIREYQRQYRAKNVEKTREYNKQYRTENAKTIREQKRQYNAANPNRHRAQLKQYRAEHVEEAREYGKQYRAENADKLRKHNQQFRAANADKIRKQKQQSHAKRVEKDQKGVWLRKAFRAAQYRAKKRGLPYDKELPDLELPDACPVLGIPLIYPKVNSKRSANSPSLDRINPILGYVASNLRVISFRANALKNDASVDELRAVIRYMES